MEYLSREISQIKEARGVFCLLVCLFVCYHSFPPCMVVYCHDILGVIFPKLKLSLPLTLILLPKDIILTYKVFLQDMRQISKEIVRLLD